MKDRQLNKDAVCIQGSDVYANKATHMVETKFVCATQVLTTRETPIDWDKAEAMMRTCAYAVIDHHDYKIDFCAANDWPLPDGCVGCDEYVSACIHPCNVHCPGTWHAVDGSWVMCKLFEKGVK